MANRRIVPLLAADVLSTTGTAMTILALPWFVLTTSGSPARAGIVLAVDFLPTALLGIPSGLATTRLGAKRSMLLCDLARVPLVAAIPLLHWAGLLSFGLLLALVFLVGVFYIPHYTSQRVVLPELLGEDETAVNRGNALLGAANRGALVSGPAMAGVLIGALGAPGVLLVDAGTFVASFTLLAVGLPSTPTHAVEAETGDVLGGLRQLARDPLLRPLGLTGLAVELAYQALIAALPILVFLRYGSDRPELAGLLLAAWAGGAMLGSAVAVRVAAVGPVRLIVGGLAVQALGFWLVALELPVGLLAAVLALTGLANPTSNAATFTLLTMRSPAGLRSKTLLAFTTGSGIGGATGLAVVGPGIEWFGLQPVLAATAAVWTLATVAFALMTRGSRAVAGSGAAPAAPPPGA